MQPIRHALLLAAVLLASAPSFAQPVLRVYHEAWCPAVDQLRMTRVKRVVAVEEGQIPAADCHPNGPVRYLGVLLYGTPPSSGGVSTIQPYSPAGDSRPKTVQVDAYERSDGTQVREHWRSAPRRD